MFTKEELSAKTLKEVKQEFATQFPAIKGIFPQFASKESLIDVMTREKSLAAVYGPMLVEEARKYGCTLGNVTPDDPLAAGTHDKVAIADTEMIDRIGHLSKVIEGFSHVPGLEKSCEQLTAVKEAFESALLENQELKSYRAPDTTTSEVVQVNADGESHVTIAGIEVPFVNGDCDIPVRDEHYRFNAWRSRVEAGGLAFEASAGDFIGLMLAGHNIQLIGPPSVGKTSLPMQIGAIAKWPTVRFNFNADLVIDDFLGCYEAINGETVWKDGALPYAVKNGCLLILDEFDRAPAEACSVLMPVLEPNGVLLNTRNPNAKPLPKHPNLRIIATSNTTGHGDTTGMYVNTKVQDSAFLNRFGIAFHVDWMSPDHEKGLLLEVTGIDAKEADTIVKVAAETRKLSRDDTNRALLNYPVTTRQAIEWAKALKATENMEKSFVLTVLGKMPESERMAVTEIAQRLIGGQFANAIPNVTASSVCADTPF